MSLKTRPYQGQVWRLVEAQHRVSTMKLVRGLADQRTLEELLDDSKPAVPADCAHLHYLLFTPFRYPARHATRYRRAGLTEGVFYAGETLKTAAAEMAFYRLLFFLESPDTAPPVGTMEMTAIAAALKVDHCVVVAPDDLALNDPVNYAPCHDLADQARGAGAGVIRYPSVREKGGWNVAVLTCAAFSDPAPLDSQTWVFRVTSDRVMALSRFGEAAHEFLFTDFADDPRVAAYLTR